jgi:hypothetical protein
MRILAVALAVTLMSLVACSGVEIPPDKQDYVGVWRAETMALEITRAGMVSYERVENGVTKEINAPIQEFRGDDFVVGVGPLNTTFRVDRLPYTEGGSWKFVVDGVELARPAGSVSS